jgi:hypothetical protein
MFCQSLECVKQFELGQSAVGCLCSAGDRVWVGVRDFLFGFDAATMRPVAQIRVGTGMVTCALVLEGRVWFCSEGSSRICVWDVEVRLLFLVASIVRRTSS